MAGLLNPKSTEIGDFVFMVLVVYLGHGVFHPVGVLFLLLQIVLGGRDHVLSSQFEEPPKKKVVHLYHRSARQ